MQCIRLIHVHRSTLIIRCSHYNLKELKLWIPTAEKILLFYIDQFLITYKWLIWNNLCRYLSFFLTSSECNKTYNKNTLQNNSLSYTWRENYNMLSNRRCFVEKHITIYYHKLKMYLSKKGRNEGRCQIFWPLWTLKPCVNWLLKVVLSSIMVLSSINIIWVIPTISLCRFDWSKGRSKAGSIMSIEYWVAILESVLEMFTFFFFSVSSWSSCPSLSERRGEENVGPWE